MDPEHDPLERDFGRLDDVNRRLELLGLQALTPDADGPMLELSTGHRRRGQDPVLFLRDGLRSR